MSLAPASNDPPGRRPGFDPAFSRRRFLAGLAAGGAALTMNAMAGAPTAPTVLPEAPEPGDWYALVSDTHIAADPGRGLFGQTMADNLRAVTSDVLAQRSSPRGVFFDGDLALKNGQVEDYGTFAGLLAPLQDAGLPLHLVLGNHDDRDNVQSALGGSLVSSSEMPGKQVGVVDLPGLQFLTLDSLDRVEATPGRLGPEQLAWLAAELDVRPKTPAVVLVHHHPTRRLRPSAVPGLTDGEDLMKVLRPRRQVKAVVFGHTHAWRVSGDDGIYLINLPAVGYSLDRRQPLGWCRLTPRPNGASLELRRVAGHQVRPDRSKLDLRWRSA